MKSVYFIRHAQSIYNTYEENQIEIHSLINPKLTEKGKNQSIELGNNLNAVTFDLVICSSLERTQSTFKLANLLYKEFEIWDECREFKINECDFVSGEDIVFETLENLYTRIEKFKEKINIKLNSSDISTIAVFSHADFIYNLLEEDKSKEYSKFHLGNAEFIIKLY